MEKAKKYKRTLIVVSAVLLVALIFVGIYLQSQPNQPKNLNPGEVREYQGENLSSINDIVDNAINGKQFINESTYLLTVNGLVNQTKEYNYSEVINGFQEYEKVVTLHCVQGWQAKILWNGILVRDLLNASGVNPAANTVIFYAKDGYTTSMPLSYFYDNDILLAYKMNGLVLPPEKGFPFQLVAESKWGYKWIKWVTQIELSNNEAYQGYWESRGYPNDATIP
jgi:DMSO/TMAO reductase YedYZ molybdopterin-dependent catalytic subunit